MSDHIVPVKKYILVWVSLLVLLGLTWGIALLNLGVANTPIALFIAGVKMMLVILFFMHVRYHSKEMWLFAAAGFFWFLIMVTFTMSDYLTRRPVKLPYNPPITAHETPKRFLPH